MRVGIRPTAVGHVFTVGCLVSLMVLMGHELANGSLLPIAAAGFVLYAGLAAADVTLVPMIVSPAFLVTARVGTGGVDLTVSDAALALSLVPACLVMFGGISPAMRRVVWLGFVYQLATLFTVLRNPYSANVVEWFHAGLLILGAAVVGWALGRHGRGGLSLTMLSIGAVLLALLTLWQGLLQYAQGDFGPVAISWPYTVQKNAIGTIFAFLAIVLYVRPAWTGWRRGRTLVGFWVLIAALMMTQSRQAVLGVVVAISVLVLRRSSTRRRSKVILLALVPAVLLVSVMVRDQVRSGNEFNSYFTRISWFEQSLSIWANDPWFGVGLRWWYTDRFETAFQPPNAFMDTGTAAGLIGLGAFILLLYGTWRVARSIDPAFGVAAELVLLARAVQSQLDLFWVSVQASLPMLILGLCLGAAAHRDADEAMRTRALRQMERATHPTAAGP